MNRTEKRLDEAYENAPCVTVGRGSRVVLMSDCHRGVGNWGDNFQLNQNLFYAALQYYNRRNYTYIELGDGDELWENRSLHDIVLAHDNQFSLMGTMTARSYARNTLRDIATRKSGCAACFPICRYTSRSALRTAQAAWNCFWCMDIRAISGTIRCGSSPGFWCELAGCNDPTSAAKNYRRKEKTERRLSAWADGRRQFLVAGHTHRPSFPRPGEGYYFNDGSCVHPRSITALELECGEISLVKWSMKVREDNLVYIGRDVLEGPEKLQEYALQMAFVEN